MKKIIPAALALGLAVAIGCSTGQITRTQQNRPTAAPTPTVTTEVVNGAIPAGAEFAIRVNETIDTKDAGGVYRAEVAQTVQDRNGRTLIQRGAPAELTIAQAKSGGAVGSRSIQLTLRSVTVNGRERLVTSASREETGPDGLGANRRTAEMVGGGAAIGAVVGAIIGGGSGAATGAAIGAAGGGATQVLTRGDTVRIPAETVMMFRLTGPLQIG